MGRPGEGGEVAALATYLASDESAFVTGQDIAIDGGLTTGLTWADKERNYKVLTDAMTG